MASKIESLLKCNLLMMLMVLGYHPPSPYIRRALAPRRVRAFLEDISSPMHEALASLRGRENKEMGNVPTSNEKAMIF